MNVKNKIIAFAMSFVICFCACSNSFANDKERITNISPLVLDGGVISAPMVGTIATLAVASGIALSSNDDIYDIARLFYNKYQDNWDQIETLFNSCVVIGSNKVVSVGKEFLEVCSKFFDETFNNASGNIVFDSSLNLPYFVTSSTSIDGAYQEWVKKGSNGVVVPWNSDNFNETFRIGNLEFVYYQTFDPFVQYEVTNYVTGEYIGLKSLVLRELPQHMFLWSKQGVTYVSYTDVVSTGNGYIQTIDKYSTFTDKTLSDIPYVPGSYSPGGVLDVDNLGIYVPVNGSDLIGSLPGDVVLGGNPSYEYGDTITLPNVSNPSIDSSVSGTFNPSLDSSPSVPNEGLWSSISDFIVSLVVPSDMFWTDLFSDFRNNLHNNFPMLDMSAFDSLLVDGKPFPNMFAFGGKVVDGDTINSIVDWLRPIVAGFVMLLLLFFNYRKLHKIIRNSDPYGSVAEKGCTSNVN